MMDDDALLPIVALLDAEDRAINAALIGLCGTMLDWVPGPASDRARRTVRLLLNNGFTPVQIVLFVEEAIRDELKVPGTVADPSAFAQAIYELAHFQYATSLEKLEGLRELAGDQARHGQRFKDGGREPGTYTPWKKWIEQKLKKDITLKPAALWELFKAKPLRELRGWRAVESTKIGKYIESPTGSDDDVTYKRFQDAVGEVKRDLKKG